MFRDTLFFISEALISMRRSSVMVVISIATIAISLIIFGFFLLVSANINNLTNFISSKLEIRVYLKQTISNESIQSFKQRIERMAGVKEVRFLDKQVAWAQFQKNFNTIQLADFVTENPLPHSLCIFLNEPDQIPTMARYLQSFGQWVDDVSYMGLIAERIELFSRFTRLAGIVLVGLLTLATLFITVNTIRLTVIARQEEIAIMHLVGATHSFIRWPFLIEGLLMGCTGSVVAVIFLKFFYYFFTVRFQNSIPYFPLVFDAFTLNTIYAIVGILGASLGILGAYISVSKTLKTTL